MNSKDFFIKVNYDGALICGADVLFENTVVFSTDCIDFQFIKKIDFIIKMNVEKCETLEDAKSMLRYYFNKQERR